MKLNKKIIGAIAGSALFLGCTSAEKKAENTTVKPQEDKPVEVEPDTTAKAPEEPVLKVDAQLNCELEKLYTRLQSEMRHDINFETADSNILLKHDSVFLQTVAPLLQKVVGENASLNEFVEVHAHADERHSNDYNQQLSFRRASKVVQHFESLGMRANAFKIFSHGEEDQLPRLEGEKDQDWWMRNRRVILQVNIPGLKQEECAAQ